MVDGCCLGSLRKRTQNSKLSIWKTKRTQEETCTGPPDPAIQRRIESQGYGDRTARKHWSCLPGDDDIIKILLQNKCKTGLQCQPEFQCHILGNWMPLFWSIKYELIRIVVTWVNTVNIFYTYGWSGIGWGYRKISRTGHNLIITDTRCWIYGDPVYYWSVYTCRGLIFSTKKWGTLLSALHLFLKADKKTKEHTNREALLYHKCMLINTLWYQCTPNWCP